MRLRWREADLSWRAIDAVVRVLLLLATSIGSVAAAATTAETVLGNGLRIIVREDHRAPTAVHMVWYRVGSLDEVNGRTGVAHVLEHMMYKGTPAVPAGEFSRRVASMGGRENAFTSQAYTCYFQRIPKQALAEVMRLEADRMRNLVVTDDDFAKEIRVVMEERRLRTDDNARARVREALLAGAFVASPMRTPVIGWMDDLESMHVEDVRDWYQRWYSPTNAVVVVAGDVDADAVFALAQQTYGALDGHPVPVRKPQREPVQRGARRIDVKAPAEDPLVVMGFKVPNLRDTSKDRDPYALAVLEAVLDGGENGRLTKRLVRAERIASGVQANYDLLSREPGLFVLGGTPVNGRTTGELANRLREAVRRVANEGVDAAELQRIKTGIVASRVYQRDSVFAQAMEIGSLVMLGFLPGDADLILERLAAVSADDVRDVARRFFELDTMTEVTLLPQPLGEPRKRVPGMRH